ncbi:MAG TPA: hypothetical protein VL972_00930 [Solirubrobacteraceae bacterium]|nr:hypothetical protein [Solirubrobacteraceae bacterium]
MTGPAGRAPLLLVAPLLLAVAILGYLAGHRHASPPRSPPLTREASNGAATLTYPTAWRVLAAAPAQLEGLHLTHALRLSPASAGAGLLVGQLAGARSEPLPAAFLASLTTTPQADVVSLAGTQAYRYTHLVPARSSRSFVLYVIPDSPTAKTVALCYAPPSATQELRECEAIVARLTLLYPSSEAQAGGDLTPDPVYAQRIAAAVARADALRVSLRAEIHAGASTAVASAAAAKLGQGLAAVAETVSTIQPPPAAGPVQTQLLEALSSSYTAYSSLATTLRGESSPAYEAAAEQVESSEAALSSALRNFSLIGYG